MVCVYVDVLLCINLLITYIFLVCTRVFTNSPTSKWGIVAGSMIGGLSSLIIFAEDINIFISVLFKISVSAAIVFLSFFPKSIKRFIRNYIAFMGVSAFFGGFMFFAEITFGTEKLLYLNGTVYLDISIKFLLGSVFVIYGIFMLLNYFSRRRASLKDIYTVKLTFRNVTVVLSACIDNCNNLTDILTGRLVVIGELKALSPFFSYEELSFLKAPDLLRVPESFVKILRFVPCKTVTSDSLLPVFTPSRVEIIKEGKALLLENICIGIVNKSLSDGEYNLLLNKNILE